MEARVDDRPVVWGFFATRWVQAADGYSAGRDGLAQVWKELYVRAVVLNSEAAPPELSIEDVSEVSEMPSAPPGFVWFPEDEEP